ncbi:MAG TPA: hypothetical protein VH478_02840 [Trebonia sp.]|nr:hypothetical protein [Trebonia sp.]
MSFDYDPGRDDASLPPVDVVIPDDARELARDVLAYRREVRARRRRERLLRLLGPLGRLRLVRHGTVFPLIATCVALSLLAGTMLSVVTIGPASAPTTTPVAADPAELPADTLEVDYAVRATTRSLGGSVLALVPAGCDCQAALRALATQAARAGVDVYFVYHADAASAAAGALAAQTAHYGQDTARTAFDASGVLFSEYRADRLTALLVRQDATVVVVRAFPAGFNLTPNLSAIEATH